MPDKPERKERLIDSRREGTSRYIPRTASELLPSFITVSFVRVSTTHFIRRLVRSAEFYFLCRSAGGWGRLVVNPSVLRIRTTMQ